MSHEYEEGDEFEDQLMTRALGLDPEDGDGDGDEGCLNLADAVDGNDYLRQVRMEAKRCQEIVVAENLKEILVKQRDENLYQTEEQMNKKKKRKKLPENFVPSLKWQEMRIEEFSSLRMKLSRFRALNMKSDEFKLPKKQDEKSWAIFCHGTKFYLEAVQCEEDEDKEEQEVDGNPPLSSIMAKMSGCQVTKLLEYHSAWMEEEEAKFTDSILTWIYALMVRVEKPLFPDTQSDLRSLASKAKSQRKKLIKNCQNPDELRIINGLSLIICIVAKYFGNQDLAD